MIKNFIAVYFLSFALLNNVYAQLDNESISVEIKKVKALSGLENLQTYQTLILFDDKSSLSFADAAKLNVSTSAKFVKVKARKNLFENAEIKKLTDYEYLLVGSGKYAVEITTFDPEKGIDEKTVVIEIGETPAPAPVPNPTPNPTPAPIPDDKFDNIGKRVSQWSAGLPKKLEISALYKKVSKDLIENPLFTITETGIVITKEREQILGQDIIKYTKLLEDLNTDLRSRWPLSKQAYAEYLLAISKGLE